MSIFFLDTSTAKASLALKSSDVIYTRESSQPNSHIEEIDELFQSLIEDAGISLKDLTAIVVGSGPGSFTGLRIGYSYVFGLASALKIPLVKIDSFNAIASAYIQNCDLVLVLSDARRSEVFSQLFEVCDSRLKALSNCSIMKIDSVQKLIQDNISQGRKIEIVGTLTENFGATFNIQSPSNIAKQMAINFQSNNLPKYSVRAISEIAPNYLRAVSALKITERVQTKT